MFRSIGLVLVACAFFSIAGGHWVVIQSVAWAEMLRAYTQQSGSLAVAVEQTFDGQHPCPLCQDIQSAKAKEHKQSPATANERDDVNSKAVTPDPMLQPVPRLAAQFIFPGDAAPFAPSRTEAPPTPPPRRGVVAA